MAVATLVGFRIFITGLIFAGKLGVLIALIATDVFDPAYFTYLNYAAGTAAAFILFVSMVWSFRIFEFYVLVVLPTITQTILVTNFAIVLIVQRDPRAFTMHLVNNDAGIVHTADYLEHYLPAVSIIVAIVAIYPYARQVLRGFILNLPRILSVLYRLYFIFAGMLPLGLYAAFFDWENNYPTGFTAATVWLLITGTCGLIGTLLLMALYLPYGASNTLASSSKNDLLPLLPADRPTAPVSTPIAPVGRNAVVTSSYNLRHRPGDSSASSGLLAEQQAFAMATHLFPLRLPM